MSKLKTVIEISIKNISVEERYYTIDYEVKVDGKKRVGSYESSYDNGMSHGEWKECLEDGQAMENIIGEIGDLLYN